MIRHITVFSFENIPGKEENVRHVRAFLEELPARFPLIKNQTVALPAAPVPALPEDAPVLFGDLVQVCDFENASDASAYPASEAHAQLMELSTPMLRKVTVIDFEL